jgi:hypothetical protein
MHSHPGKLDGTFLKAVVIALGLCALLAGFGPLLLVVAGVGILLCLTGILFWFMADCAWHILFGSSDKSLHNYLHPAQRLVRQDQRQAARAFAVYMQQATADFAEVERTFHSMSPADQEKMRDRYRLWTQQAERWRETVEARTSNMEAEVKLAVSLMHQDATYRLRDEVTGRLRNKP